MKNSKIEWCHHTFNPWVGCTKVSPACDNCYAEGWANRYGKGHLWNGERARTSATNWKWPYKFEKEARESGKRIRVFSGSLCDIFDNQVPQEWRNDLFRVIADTPHLDWLLLTKRIGNVQKFIKEEIANVWIGATICNQEEANRDIPKLLKVPAAKHFLSMEPLLGAVDISRWLGPQCDNGSVPSSDGTCGVMCERCNGFGTGCPGIDWVIVGGESGPKARPMHPDWARSLRDQCKAAGVPFFFKQWGAWVTVYDRDRDDPDWRNCPKPKNNSERYLNINGGHGFHGDRVVFCKRVSKEKAGSLLDGVEHKEVPA